MNERINVGLTGKLGKCEARTSKAGKEYLRASVRCGDQWVTVALGWEVVGYLWPLLILAAVGASFITYLVVRRTKAGNCPAPR